MKRTILLFATLSVCLASPAVPADDATDVRGAIERWAAGPAQDSAAFVGQFADTVSQSFVGGTYRRRLSREDIARRLPRERMVERDLRRSEINVTADTAWASSVLLRDAYGDFECMLTLRRSGDRWLIAGHDFLRRIAPELNTTGLGPEYIALTERWAGWNLSWCDSVLRANPANGGDPRLRRQAHHMLDEPLHLNSATLLASVRDYLRSRIDAAIAEMQSEEVVEGATVWKLYNHGFVVRTATHTWGHDIVHGSGEMRMSDAQMDSILGQLDALFCSHWHGDHTDTRVVERATVAGVLVVLPPLPDSTTRWGAYIHSGNRAALEAGQAIVPDRDASTRIDTRSGALDVHIYPGHQRTLENNVYVVTSDSMSIMHFGDQSSDDDLSGWVARVGDERRIDLMLPNVWTEWIKRVADGVRPRAAIPGHENELGHRFELRHAYDKAVAEYSEHMGPRGIEWHVLAWGERVHIEPADGR